MTLNKQQRSESAKKAWATRKANKKKANLGKSTASKSRRPEDKRRSTNTHRVNKPKPGTVLKGKQYCPRCDTIKEFAEFNKNKRGRNGLQTYCRGCQHGFEKIATVKRTVSTRPVIVKPLLGIVDESKEKGRAVVSRFFLKHHPKGGRILSLPGTAWDFESKLAARQAGTEFVCVEGNGKVFKASIKRAIGKEPVEMVEEVGEYLYDFVWTSRVRFVNATIEDMLTWPKQDPLKGEWLIDRYMSWTGIWLDLCGNVSKALFELLRALPNGCAKARVPIAVTIQRGRESQETSLALLMTGKEGDEARAAFIAAALGQNFKIKAVHNYSGDRPMLTIMGILDNR